MTPSATILARISIAALAISAATSHAADWDANRDFTPLTTSNPNGAWRYGYDPAAVPGYQELGDRHAVLELDAVGVALSSRSALDEL